MFEVNRHGSRRLTDMKFDLDVAHIYSAAVLPVGTTKQKEKQMMLVVLDLTAGCYITQNFVVQVRFDRYYCLSHCRPLQRRF